MPINYLPIDTINFTPNIIWKLHIYVNKKGEDECWRWLGAIPKRKNGKYSYPVLGINGTSYRVSRLTYYLTHNIDPKELEVCHLCNNPVCCNPKHLYLGTHAQNMADASRDGLFNNRKGIMNDNCQLSDEDVKEIRRLRKQGMKLRELSEQYCVTMTHISDLCNGKFRV